MVVATPLGRLPNPSLSRPAERCYVGLTHVTVNGYGLRGRGPIPYLVMGLGSVRKYDVSALLHCRVTSRLRD
jgi:hypothetical protein